MEIMRFIVASIGLLAWMMLAMHAKREARRGAHPLLTHLAPFPVDVLAWGNPGGLRLIELWGGFDALPGFEQKREALSVIVDPFAVEERLISEECLVWRDVFLLLPFGAPLLIAQPFWLIFWLAGLMLRVVGSSYSLQRKARTREREVAEALGDVLTRLILSLHAGTLPVVAWNAVAQEGNTPLHQEMQRVLRRVEAGESLRVVVASLPARYHVTGLSDMTQLFAQSLELGGADLADGLERIRSRLYAERTRQFVVEAERASQRMMFPSLLLFAGILLLVMTPVIGR
ncbi:MAG: type II secretion system F family protein [Peptoniphilaceae bacterium]|nr:type II secretion system F family protein [Peptoniphilaceae bacterium]MDY6085862.1 type II secretion system F family protein [Peptoniphilaceae bacterium]